MAAAPASIPFDRTVSSKWKDASKRASAKSSTDRRRASAAVITDDDVVVDVDDHTTDVTVMGL